MVIPQWLLIAVPMMLVGLWLLRSREHQSRPDSHFLAAPLHGTEKHMGFSQMMRHVLLVLAALVMVWFLLNAEFGGIVFHFSLAGK